MRLAEAAHQSPRTEPITDHVNAIPTARRPIRACRANLYTAFVDAWIAARQTGVQLGGRLRVGLGAERRQLGNGWGHRRASAARRSPPPTRRRARFLRRHTLRTSRGRTVTNGATYNARSRFRRRDRFDSPGSLCERRWRDRCLCANQVRAAASPCISRGGFLTPRNLRSSATAPAAARFWVWPRGRSTRSRNMAQFIGARRAVDRFFVADSALAVAGICRAIPIRIQQVSCLLTALTDAESEQRPYAPIRPALSKIANPTFRSSPRRDLSLQCAVFVAGTPHPRRARARSP